MPTMKIDPVFAFACAAFVGLVLWWVFKNDETES